MIRTQQQDTFCRIAAAPVEQLNGKFIVSQEGLPVREAHLDGVIQFVLPLLLGHRILLMLRYSPLAGHLG